MTYYSENIHMEKPLIEIEYCHKCRWMLRATWISQELLSTFGEDVRGVTLIPSGVSGIFEIRSDRTVIWARGKKMGFPEIRELKQKVRDVVAPDRDLGHIDK